MQIQVVTGSSPALFNATLFPEATPETTQWLNDQFHRDTSMLTDMGRQFLDNAVEYWKKSYDPNLMRRVRAMTRELPEMAHPNIIRVIRDIDGVQNAQPVMQRYIMANPSVRKLYHRQLCDGYSDSYVDLEPGVIGDDHYDYRRVMEGIVVMLPIPGSQETTWQVSMYPEELAEGDRSLDADEQFIILDAWELSDVAIQSGIDPVNKDGGELEV